MAVRMILCFLTIFNFKHYKGELLSLNFQVTYAKNIAKLLQNVEEFGPGTLGNGATLTQMPLLNILVLFMIAPPTSIVD